MKTLDIEKLATAIKNDCLNIQFAYLFGSAQSGQIGENSDIDIAIYIADTGKKMETLSKAYEVIEPFVGDTLIDLIFLNGAEPIIAFEALKGRKLFVRENAIDLHAGFYSITCREYESQIYWMKQQLIYRGYEVQWDY